MITGIYPKWVCPHCGLEIGYYTSDEIKDPNKCITRSRLCRDCGEIYSAIYAARRLLQKHPENSRCLNIALYELEKMAQERIDRSEQNGKSS